MLDEVPEHHVPAPGSQTDTREVLSFDPIRQPLRESRERLERLEDLAIAGRIGAPALHDVGPILPVLPGRVEELRSLRQGIRERGSQRSCLFGREDEFGVVEENRDGVATTFGPWALSGLRIAREFLDQPRRRDFPYPPRVGSDRESTSYPVISRGD
ncbi:MAG: hypothetical protein ABEI31_07670 [Halodesulfurarchaeum sp.]